MKGLLGRLRGLTSKNTSETEGGTSSKISATAAPPPLKPQKKDKGDKEEEEEVVAELTLTELGRLFPAQGVLLKDVEIPWMFEGGIRIARGEIERASSLFDFGRFVYDEGLHMEDLGAIDPSDDSWCDLNLGLKMEDLRSSIETRGLLPEILPAGWRSHSQSWHRHGLPAGEALRSAFLLQPDGAFRLLCHLHRTNFHVDESTSYTCTGHLLALPRWSPTLHHFYSADMRSRVQQALLILKLRFRLPKDIVMLILARIPERLIGVFEIDPKSVVFARVRTVTPQPQREENEEPVTEPVSIQSIRIEGVKVVHIDGGWKLTRVQQNGGLCLANC